MSLCGSIIWDTTSLQKVEHFSENVQLLKNRSSSQVQKNLFLAHFYFLKYCHSITDQDFSIKPTANGQNFLRKQVKDLNPFLSYSNFKSGPKLNLTRNFDDFREILVQNNKAVLGWSNKPMSAVSTLTFKYQHYPIFKILQMLFAGSRHGSGFIGPKSCS